MRKENLVAIISLVVGGLIIAGAFIFSNLIISKTGDRQSNETPLPNYADAKPTDLDFYKNTRLGFSIGIPKKVEIGNIYFPQESPIRVLDDGKNNFVYVRPFHRMTSPYSNTDESLVENTFSAVNSNFYQLYDNFTWKIVIGQAHNDQELEAFIKRQYHETCAIDKKIPSQQEEIFDIIVRNTAEYQDDGCFLNFKYVIKYSPKKQKVASWNIGQDSNFADQSEDGRLVTHFDYAMADSFKFE